jgi:sec-independent protein translocase protein TatA
MTAAPALPLAFSLGPMEMAVVAIIALLLFGKDLPNVAKEWARTFNEFRRHLNSVKSELNEAIYAEPERPKLQYHPEFHNRDPLPEPILAEGKGDLAPTAVAGASGSAEAAATDFSNDEVPIDATEPARPVPSD